MEGFQSEAFKELNVKCKTLAKDLKKLPKDTAECEQPFDLDLDKLDRIRFELIATHHELIIGRAPDRITLDNELDDSVRETTFKKQLEDMKVVCDIQRSSIQNKVKDSELNKDTRECFLEILEAIEDKDDAEVERSETKRRLVESKAHIRYILEKFYPDHQNELLSILEKLEKNQKTEEEDEEKWLDLSEHDLASILILKRAMIIEQHKTNLSFFRFAPLT